MKWFWLDQEFYVELFVVCNKVGSQGINFILWIEFFLFGYLISFNFIKINFFFLNYWDLIFFRNQIFGK